MARNKLRSFLTMLGVIIGVASVISVAAIINGLNRQITDQVRLLGSQVFFVTRFKAFQFERWPEEIRKRKYLTYDDAVAIREQCPSVAQVAPMLTRFLFFGYENEVRYRQNRVRNPIVRGAEPNYPEVLPVFSVKEGRFFTEEENLHAAPVAVLGSGVADSLFGTLDPIGREIRLNGRPFVVIGVFEPHQGLFGGPGVDQFVLIPYRTFAKLYPEIEELILAVSVADPRLLERAQEEVTEVLRRRRGVPFNKPNDFEISAPDVLTELWNDLTSAVVALTLILASVALVVGGIGVMNIMLVSVTERTAEIGLRKAVGARRRDIGSQFLLEAVTLTSLGGLFGVLVGIALSAAVAWSVPSLPARVSLYWTGIAFAMAVAVGLFFGIYPALRAARLEPVRCLRYE
jgi:putative ABC transport system permease protein